MPVTALEPTQYEAGHATLLAGLRRQPEFAESVRTIPEQWQALRSLGNLPRQVGANTYGVIGGEDPGGFEYLCGAEVESFVAPGNESFREWLPGSGFESAQRPDFEVYDQRFYPRTGQGIVEIWIAIGRARVVRAPVLQQQHAPFPLLTRVTIIFNVEVA